MSRRKIAECEVGDQVVMPLVVTGANARETKAKKPYLQMDLFDGFEKISGNYWDWASGKIPEKNSILLVTAQVTEWQGVKQLNISKLNTTTDYTIADFMPSSGIDVNAIFEGALTMIDDMDDPTLKTLCAEAYRQLKAKWLSIPGAITIHHAYAAGALIHSVEAACVAKAISCAIAEANEDLCVAAALLHDLGKLFSYRINGVVVEYTDEGYLFDHTFIGANFISNFADKVCDSDNPFVQAKLNLLVHCILSHHGKLEFGAAVPPKSLEAHIVDRADGISAAAEILRTAKPQGEIWTERVWALENVPHIQLAYTDKIFAYQDEAPLMNEYNLPGDVSTSVPISGSRATCTACGSQGACLPSCPSVPTFADDYDNHPVNSTCCVICNSTGPCEHDGV